MPGDPEHPVTVLGDLRVMRPCMRATCKYASHRLPATVADLVSALRAEGELILEDLGDCYRYTTLYRYHATGLTMQEAFEAEGGHL